MTEKKATFFTRLATAWRYLFGGGELPAEPKEPLALPAPAPAPVEKEKAWASGLYLLAILQREGRFIDFLMEDVTAFPDADVAAAARVVHQGCRKVLLSSVNPAPAHDAAEGASVTVPQGFDANLYRLVGNVTGSGPYTGALKHHGWVARSIALPELPTAMDPKVLAPAEVELP